MAHTKKEMGPPYHQNKAVPILERADSTFQKQRKEISELTLIYWPTKSETGCTNLPFGSIGQGTPLFYSFQQNHAQS